MSDPDDIERLLAEINAMDNAPARRDSGTVEPASGKEIERSGNGRGRMSWVGISAIGGGVVGLIVGSILFFLPWVSAMSTGVGAALGAAVVALISGPPGWYSGTDD